MLDQKIQVLTLTNALQGQMTLEVSLMNLTNFFPSSCLQISFTFSFATLRST